MGKRKRVKGNKHIKKNGKGKSSTSSASMKMSRGGNQTTDNKIEGGGNESKKIKGVESLNSSCVELESGAGQSQEYKEVVMDDLPPEMLMEILKCLSSRCLFDCRLVNRNWNEISCGILRNRPYNFTNFEYEYGRLLWLWAQFTQYGDESLGDFVTCIKKSKACPFSQFYFLITEDVDPLKIFKRKDFKEFISHFASSPQRLKCLHLSFEVLNDLETFKMLTQELSDLVLNKIPRLEEFSLGFTRSIKAPEVKLFSTPIDPEIIMTDHGSVPVPVQLAHLKVLHIRAPMISSYTEIMKDLLNAAVNLKYISMEIHKPGDFQFLHFLGKLHLLKKVDINLDENFLSSTESDKNWAALSFLKLESLEVRVTMYESSPLSLIQAAKFLGKLLESSKDTLTKWESNPIGRIPGLQLPTFKKLWKLKLAHWSYFPEPVFPPRIRERDVFPAVSDLDLDVDLWDSAFPQEDSIPVFPNVKILRLKDSKCPGNAISIFTSMCPNLRKFKMHKQNDYPGDDNPPKLKLLNVGRSIWTHMKKLEVLEFDVDVDLPENNSFALDSCFTGISVEHCKRLSDLKEANKLLNKWGFHYNAPESVLKAEREFPSILDMKDLKELIINPYFGEKVLKKTEFFTKLSWISEEYAFKFLPHFKPKPEPTEEGQV